LQTFQIQTVYNLFYFVLKLFQWSQSFEVSGRKQSSWKTNLFGWVSFYAKQYNNRSNFWLTKNGLLWRNSYIWWTYWIEFYFFSNDNLTLRFGPILSSVSFSKYFVINLETDCYFFFCPCSAQIGSFSSLLPFLFFHIFEVKSTLRFSILPPCLSLTWHNFYGRMKGPIQLKYFTCKNANLW
jgi:hypothetical protein